MALTEPVVIEFFLTFKKSKTALLLFCEAASSELHLRWLQIPSDLFFSFLLFVSSLELEAVSKKKKKIKFDICAFEL